MTADVRVSEPHRLVEGLAADFSREGQAALSAGRRFSIALSGGSVATLFFPELSAAGLDWDRCDFFWIDERAVPPEDPESNFGLARRLWFAPARVPLARCHRMPAEARDSAEAAAGYSALLEHVCGRPPVLEYALVGVGPDGHVASLFPGHALLAEETRLVASLDDAPKPPPRRMTLTMPVIARARRVVIAAMGAAKRDVMHEALTAPDASMLPVAQLIRRTSRVLVLLDKDAGHGLAQ